MLRAHPHLAQSTLNIALVMATPSNGALQVPKSGDIMYIGLGELYTPDMDPLMQMVLPV